MFEESIECSRLWTEAVDYSRASWMLPDGCAPAAWFSHANPSDVMAANPRIPREAAVGSRPSNRKRAAHHPLDLKLRVQVHIVAMTAFIIELHYNYNCYYYYYCYYY